MFHPRCGHCVSLSNGNKTACRTNPHHEFDRGLVFSLEPIKDNEVFEIKIDKKLNTWSGSVEIGVTVCNPDVIDIPFTATDLRGGTWVLLGHGVLRDGRSVMEAYGCDLDQLVEGDRVGVMRSGHGELEFYVNGESQGVAAINLPPLLYAVVDMYGKCAQISLTSPLRSPDSNTLEVDSPSAISGSCSGSESNALLPAAPPLQDHRAAEAVSALPGADALSGGASAAHGRGSGSQIFEDFSQAPELRSSRTATEERNQHIQLEPTNAHNRNRVAQTGQVVAGSGVQADAGRDHGPLDAPVSEEADLLMPLAACSLRRGEDSDDSPEEEEETDARDKGNEKHRSRSGNNNDSSRAAPVRDSNIILSNTEQLCRLLNVTMESIMNGACGSGPSATSSSAAIASAPPAPARPGCYAPKEPANIALCDEDICNDSEEGEEDAAQCVARFRDCGFESAFVNNTINTIRQCEDHCQRQLNGTTASSVDHARGSDLRVDGSESTARRKCGECSAGGAGGAEHDGRQVCHSRPAVQHAGDCQGSTSCVSSSAPNASATSSVASDSSSQVALLLSESNFPQVPCSSSSQRGRAVETVLALRGPTGGGGAARRSSSGGRRSSASNNSSPYRYGRRSRCALAASEGASHRSSSSSRPRPDSAADTSDGPAFSLARNLVSDVSGTPVLLSARVRDSSPSSPTRTCLRGGAVEPRLLAPPASGSEVPPAAAGVVCAVKSSTSGARGGGGAPGPSAAGCDGSNVPPLSETDPPEGDESEEAVGGGGRSSPPPQSSQPSPSGRAGGVDRLQFHEKCGMLVRLSNHGRTAERVHPLDEFNNGVVMSNRALRENELFEIRIDRLVEKWSGSIEVGITTHNPATLEFPATMTNLRSGTTMMSGTGILKNGKGMLRQYGDFNLDELQEGDRIGMMIRSGRTLHYFINGLEQGVAATDVPSPVWSVVDLYGMTVKVTLVDRDSRQEQNLLTRQMAQAEEQQRSGVATSSAGVGPPLPCELDNCVSTDPLVFSPFCGSSAQVINGGLTALRPNALEDFNHGVVLTARPLRPGEMLEVRLDQCVYMWAGSLEIGVTTHAPHSFEYPSTMTKVTSGTWMMTGDGGVKHNGTTIINEYGLNLDRLQVGDRAGVVRHADGFLHFFVNGADQGRAATGVPECVYGVVDLYGQAAQATIVRRGAAPLLPDREEQSTQVPATDGPETSAAGAGLAAAGRASHQPQARVVPLQQQVQPQVPAQVQQQVQPQMQQQVPSGSTVYSDLRFHELHGRNASVIRNGLGAERPHADAEFNDAIVISNRQLHEGEMFEVMIEKVVDRWSGSLEAGVTAIRPEDIEFPSTMTDIDYDTWMLSGSSVMMNGVTIKNNYACDLDSLGIGSRIGMMRHADATLHYYVNGVDQGAACSNLPAGIWAVVDLYGQCAQVSIVHNPVHCDQLSSAAAARLADSKRQQQLQQKAEMPGKEQVCHQFSHCHGAGVAVSEGRGALHRTGRQEGASARTQVSCLAFTSSPLAPHELFEVRITRLDPELRGSIRIGLTTLPMLPNLSIQSVPPSLSSVHPVPPSDTWWVGDSDAYHNFSGWKLPVFLPGISGPSALDDAAGARPALGRSGNESGARNVSFADKYAGSSSRMNTAWTISLSKPDFCPHLSKLVVGDRIGVERTSDGRMRLYINGVDFGVAATGIQESSVVLGVVELHGSCMAVETTSCVREDESSVSGKAVPGPSGAVAAGLVSQDSLELSAVGVAPSAESSTPGNVQPRVSGNADSCRPAEAQSASASPFPASCPPGGALLPDVASGIRYSTRTSFAFSGRHGKNILLSADRTIAVRKKGYNYGLMVTSRPLPRNTMFTVMLSGVDPTFCGGAMLGLLFPGTAVPSDDSSLSNTVLPDDVPVAASSLQPNDASRSSLSLPEDSSRCGHVPLPEDVPGSALDLLAASRECVLICGANVYRGQAKVCSDYGPDLNSLAPGTTLGLCIDAQARLHLFVNGVDCGVAACDLPHNPYVLLDLYGAANEAHIVNSDDAGQSGVAEQALKKKAQHNNNQQQQQQSRRHLQQQQQQQQLHQNSSADGESFVLSNHDEMNLAISRSMQSSAEHGLTCGAASSERPDALGGVAPCNKSASLHSCNHSTSCLDHDSAASCKALKSSSLDNSTNCNSVFHTAPLSDVNNGSAASLNGSCQVAASHSANTTGSGCGALASLPAVRTQQNKVKASARGVDGGVKRCSYERLCCRFLASLSLPGAYLSSDVLCYCGACHAARGEEAVYTKGNGVEYHRPLGWCRYGLVSGSSDGACDSWHMAYCAARPGHVRRMLDKGELLFPGELELGFPRRGGRSKEEEGDGSMLSVSPSVAVAAAAALPTTGLLERGCGRSYSGRVLLQVAVKPGAYKKLDCDHETGGGVTAAVAGPTAAHSDNRPHTRVRWVTKERGATQLLALLVAVEQVEKT